MTATSIIPVGNYDWYVLRTIGAKYFLLAESPLFRGYYSLKKGTFAESKLYSFLNNKFMAKLESNGVDTEKISNVGILTSGQYQMYVKDKLPVSASPYLLQTPSETDSDSVLAVNSSGDLYPIGIQVSCGIRPCMFIDKEYADSIMGIDPSTISGVALESETKPKFKSEQDAQGEIYSKLESSETERDKEPENDTEGDNENDRNETDMDKNTENVGLTSEDNVTEVNNDNPNDVGCKTEHSNDFANTDTEEKLGEIEPTVEEETLYGNVETDNKTVKITTIGSQHAAYVFEDEYEEYAVLFEGGKEELEKILTEYGLTIRSFLQSSVISDRKSVTTEDIQSIIRNQQKRFRWREIQKR